MIEEHERNEFQMEIKLLNKVIRRPLLNSDLLLLNDFYTKLK